MKKLLISAAAIAMATSFAVAGPTIMADDQMDKIVAGTATILISPPNRGIGAAFECSYGACMPTNGAGDRVGKYVPGPNDNSAFMVDSY